MRIFLVFFFVIIASLGHANAMAIHCKYVGDTDCTIENKPQKITGNNDCNNIPQFFDKDTILYIGHDAQGELACSNKLHQATYNQNSTCPQPRVFYQDDAQSLVLFCVNNDNVTITYDEGDPANFSYAHKQCIGSNGTWANGTCDCGNLEGATLVNNECLCTDNPNQKYYNATMTGCNTLADGVNAVWGSKGPLYVMGGSEDATLSRYDRANSCEISGGTYNGTFGDPSLPNTCDCTKAPNMRINSTEYFCECIEGYDYKDPTSKYLGCIPTSEIDYDKPDISENNSVTDETPPPADDCTASGGTIGEDGKCQCGDGLKPNADETKCEATDGVITGETGALNAVNTEKSTASQDTAVKEAEDAYKKAKENEQSFANRTLGAASTAATGLGLMTAASAYSEQRADEAAEKDMTAYLETFRCEYGRGQTAKAGNEEITLPGGNDLLTYYTEYKNIADALKATKKALGMRPGIEEEVVYDRAETGLYQYSSVGKTGGAYTSLSRALTDEESEDAAAWATQKDETAKKLKGGGIAAGAGVAGGVLGNTAINTDTFKNMFNSSEE